jgi:hypothetical protein
MDFPGQDYWSLLLFINHYELFKLRTRFADYRATLVLSGIYILSDIELLNFYRTI